MNSGQWKVIMETAERFNNELVQKFLLYQEERGKPARSEQVFLVEYPPGANKIPTVSVGYCGASLIDEVIDWKERGFSYAKTPLLYMSYGYAANTLLP